MPRQRKRSSSKSVSGAGADLAHVLAKNVRRLRLSRSQDQADLSLASGLHLRTVQRVEGPEGVADLNTLACLAVGLATHPSTLIL